MAMAEVCDHDATELTWHRLKLRTGLGIRGVVGDWGTRTDGERDGKTMAAGSLPSMGAFSLSGFDQALPPLPPRPRAFLVASSARVRPRAMSPIPPPTPPMLS